MPAAVDRVSSRALSFVRRGAGRGRLWPLLLCAALLATAYAGAGGADTLSKKARELKQLKSHIEALRHQLHIDQGRQDSLRSQLRDTEKRIGAISRALKETTQALERQGRKLAELQQDKRRHEAQLGKQRDELAQQVRAAFVIGRQGYLKLLLDQQDPAAVSRNLRYYDYFNRARAKRIHAVSRELDQINALQASISRQVQTLNRLQGRQRQEKAGLQDQLEARGAVLAKVNARVKTKSQRLTGLLDNEHRLETLVQHLRKALSDIPDTAGSQPFGRLKGRLQWPSQGAIENRFGDTRRLGNLKWHGVLIDAGLGADVHAVYHGRVAFADWLRGFGLLIIIDHGDGYMSLYGHNQSLYKEVGDWVETGEVIASVGNSGGRNHPGLYFEIRHNGVPTNPVLWCKR